MPSPHDLGFHCGCVGDELAGLGFDDPQGFAQAEQNATLASSAAAAYEQVFASVVPPPVIALNRAQLTKAVDDQRLGPKQPGHLPARVAIPGDYWAQNATALSTPTKPSRERDQTAGTGQAGTTGHHRHRPGQPGRVHHAPTPGSGTAQQDGGPRHQRHATPRPTPPRSTPPSYASCGSC